MTLATWQQTIGSSSPWQVRWPANSLSVSSFVRGNDSCSSRVCPVWQSLTFFILFHALEDPVVAQRITILDDVIRDV
jgi:hypothetical protein